MKKPSLITAVIAAAVIALVSIGAAGCASVPTKDELVQLETLQAEIASLEQRKSDLKSEHSILLASISDKDIRIKEVDRKKNELMGKN